MEIISAGGLRIGCHLPQIYASRIAILFHLVWCIVATGYLVCLQKLILFQPVEAPRFPTQEVALCNPRSCKPLAALTADSMETHAMLCVISQGTRQLWKIPLCWWSLTTGSHSSSSEKMKGRDFRKYKDRDIKPQKCWEDMDITFTQNPPQSTCEDSELDQVTAPDSGHTLLAHHS